MTQENYERELGGINAKLDTLTADMHELKGTLATISMTGCAVGRDLTRRVTAVEGMPDSRKQTWMVIAAGLATLAAWVPFLIQILRR